MDGVPFFLPISIDWLVAIVGVIVIGIIIVLALPRGVRAGGVASKDFVIVLRSNAPAQSYPIEPVAPTKLYQYKRENGDTCLLIADTQPIPFISKKQARNMFIAVESDLVSLAVDPGSVDALSSVSDAIKDVSSDDIINVVSYMLEKKSDNNLVAIPPNLRVAVTYKYAPKGISIIEKLLKADASIISTVIAGLRAASAAKELAQAAAIRAGAEARRWYTLALVIVMIMIGLAVFLAIVGIKR